MRLAGAVLPVSLAAALPLAAQSANHIGEPMAEVLLANGCAMSEADLAAAMDAGGWHVSDFQAQVLALFKGGYIHKAADGRLTLTGWGNCR